MMTAWIHILKSQLVVVLLCAVAAVTFYGCMTAGLLENDRVLLEADAAFEELLGRLPTVGDWLQNAFHVLHAVGNRTSFQVKMYSEIAYALILFFCYKLMNAVRRLGGQLFMMSDGGGIVATLCGLLETFAVVFASVVQANILNRIAEKLLDAAGVDWGMAILFAVIVCVVLALIAVGRKRGVLAAMIDVAGKCLLGIVALCLIYMTVLLSTIITGWPHLTTTEMIGVLIGEVLCILALTVLGAKSFAEGIGGLLKNR